MNGFGLQTCAPGPNSPAKLAVPFTLTPCTANLRSAPPANGARDAGASKLEQNIMSCPQNTLVLGHGETWLLQEPEQPELSGGTQQLLQVPRISETSDTKALLDAEGVFWIINTSFGFFSLRLLWFPEGIMLHCKSASLAVEGQV